MNPERLIGMELGQGVLQRLLGQGTMGAVYLAYQAHLQRQVAIKVFLPASQLETADYAEFSQRLKQEISRARVLEHEHILAILDQDEHKGLIYEVLPYVIGESLQARLSRSGMLPFAQVQHYLEQMAVALDYAHTQGILHRDVKPENILVTADDRLFVTDFCVASVTTEKNFARVRQAAPGMLNYIAPEYVLAQAVDVRADLYSLGTILYHMVTGAPPFQGTSLGEAAMKHVKMAPASPRLLRKELPEAAEQVILRSIAKHPADRYSRAQDMASAFRLALEVAQVLPTEESSTTSALDVLSDIASGGATAKMARIARPRGNSLFNPKWQEIPPSPNSHDLPVSNPAAVPPTPVLPAAPEATALPTSPGAPELVNQGKGESKLLTNASTNQIPSTPFASNGPRRTGLLRFANPQAGPAGPSMEQSQTISGAATNSSLKIESKATWNTEELPLSNSQSTTGMLNVLTTLPKDGETTGTMKLTEAVKIVQVPLAGQPGRFVTGFLPMLPPDQAQEEEKDVAPKRSGKRLKLVSMMLAILIVAAGSGFFFWSTHNSKPGSTTQQTQKQLATPDLKASATAYATATANAGLILTDTLSQNIHDWPVGHQGQFTYTFKDGAYHIANNDKDKSAPALLPHQTINGPFSYSLTMQQIKGDLKSLNNQFGMILYATTKNVQGKQINQFYAFEVLNKADGQYQFWKYDNSKNSTQPWKSLWTKNFGKEFHQGSGSSHINTLKIVATGKMFTFFVNGKQVGTCKESAFSSGSVGMLVNLDGAEVAFSNLLLTHA